MSRRALVATAWVLGAVMTGALVVSQINSATRRLGLPLSNATVIRTQASAKHLDPALIAAVIYAETKFDPRPSAAGAQGLMQILPETAYFIARRSGGTRFQASDLATPSVNVAYGSYYLRYLLDHYAGNQMLASLGRRGRVQQQAGARDRGERHSRQQLGVIPAAGALIGLGPAAVEHVFAARMRLEVTGRDAEHLAALVLGDEMLRLPAGARHGRSGGLQREEKIVGDEWIVRQGRCAG